MEWIHRAVAVVIGFEVIGLAALASSTIATGAILVAATVGAVVLVGFQAWLGRETVRLGTPANR